MALWWFKDRDVKIAALEIWNDKCYGFIVPEESPAQYSGILRELCRGMEEELMTEGKSFSKYKKYYINDYHFERFD